VSAGVYAKRHEVFDQGRVIGVEVEQPRARKRREHAPGEPLER
jgi:hypothetical protein